MFKPLGLTCMLALHVRPIGLVSMRILYDKPMHQLLDVIMHVKPIGLLQVSMWTLHTKPADADCTDKNMLNINVVFVKNSFEHEHICFCFD